MASPALASSSSALSAWKSYITMPYTMAPDFVPDLDARWPAAALRGMAPRAGAGAGTGTGIGAAAGDPCEEASA